MSWNPISAIIGGVAKMGAELGSAYFAHKTAKEGGKLKIAQGKIDLKMAKISGQIARVKQKETNDTDYDMQVLRNRQTTWADEILILVTISIWLMHFIPDTQPYMADGWAAMGYVREASEGGESYGYVPWWFEFVIVGIFVSTLGLMRLLRLFMGKRKEIAK